MKIILQHEVKDLGEKGAIVKVKDGFARNFLLPKGLALKATAANLETIERKLKLELQRKEEDKNKAQEFANKLLTVSCTVIVDAQQDDKLYGSVTASDIASALLAEGITLDKKQIILDKPIKALGIYDVGVKVHPQVAGKVKVWVVKK